MAWPALPGTEARAESMRYVPRIEGDPWQVAGNPDLGEYTTDKQEPVDFAVWQAADGTWQLWSCIRNTACGGNTRLLYRWEGKTLTEPDWKPMGIAMEAKTELGEAPGGLQAPYVFKQAGRYVMAYGDWENICFATGNDGKEFHRILLADTGKPAVFRERAGSNTRDPMIIKVGDVWHCYYCAYPGLKNYVYCRRSRDLQNWSDSSIVAYGGFAGTGPASAECPFVVEVKPDQYALFRTQQYGQGAQTCVYNSGNPLNFGIDDDYYLVGTLPIAAPEIIHHDGRYYIAYLNPGLDGIRIAKLAWDEKPARRLVRPVFDFNNPGVRKQWTRVSGDIELFVTAKRTPFNAIMDYFIATAELPDASYDDDRTGVLESWPFTLQDDEYAWLISGGDNIEKLYVALIDAETGEELVRHTGHDANLMREVYIDTSAHKGKTVKLRVVDQAKGPWGKINFGGMYHVK